MRELLCTLNKLTDQGFQRIIRLVFPGSSMVEQEAVNFEVAGSSPAPGAKLDTQQVQDQSS